jgi:hypothetical protein
MGAHGRSVLRRCGRPGSAAPGEGRSCVPPWAAPTGQLFVRALRGEAPRSSESPTFRWKKLGPRWAPTAGACPGGRGGTPGQLQSHVPPPFRASAAVPGPFRPAPGRSRPVSGRFPPGPGASRGAAGARGRARAPRAPCRAPGRGRNRRAPAASRKFRQVPALHQARAAPVPDRPGPGGNHCRRGRERAAGRGPALARGFRPRAGAAKIRRSAFCFLFSVRSAGFVRSGRRRQVWRTGGRLTQPTAGIPTLYIGIGVTLSRAT